MSQLIEPIPVDAVRGILEAFDQHSLVALGEAHWLQQEADFIAQIIKHPDFIHRVQTIVVEFGNAYYQPVVDRFIGGETVAEEELKFVWRNVGGGQAFESPIYAQFFDTVRTINQKLPILQRLRVLLGDPPVDWQNRQHDADAWRILNARDAHYATVVERHVLTHGQRALLIAGSGHFSRISDATPHEGNVVQRLELKDPGCIYVVVPHVIFEETLTARRDEVRALEAQLAAWPIPAVASVHGTWLGELDAFVHFDNLAKIIEPNGHERLVRVDYLRSDSTAITELRLSEMIDALLYFGPQHMLTFTAPPRYESSVA